MRLTGLETIIAIKLNIISEAVEPTRKNSISRVEISRDN